MRCVCFFWFCSSWSVIQLSVYTRTIFSPDFEFCIYSSAFRIAKCSAWLLEQRLCSLYFNVAVMLFSEKIAIPDPTLMSLLLPSVYACMKCRLSSCPSVIFTCVWVCVGACVHGTSQNTGARAPAPLVLP
jgi:hypothetical protein